MAETDIADAARRHGLSEGAAKELFRALVSGGGGQAQFSHPDLGGMGQWSGGMTQIGDMFNDELKGKVSGFCRDMAAAARSKPTGAGETGSASGTRGAPSKPSPWAVEQRNWWPDSLGAPSSSGSQNDMSYACFPDKHRLALSRDGKVTVYDTGEHRLSGFSQQQSGTADLSFSGQNGPVSLDSLKRVDA